MLLTFQSNRKYRVQLLSKNVVSWMLSPFYKYVSKIFIATTSMSVFDKEDVLYTSSSEISLNKALKKALIPAAGREKIMYRFMDLA